VSRLRLASFINAISLHQSQQADTTVSCKETNQRARFCKTN